MTISEKVAYLKGLAEGLNIDTDKSKEGKLITVIIGILEEIGMSIEDLEENNQALGETTWRTWSPWSMRKTMRRTTRPAPSTTTISRPSVPPAGRTSWSPRRIWTSVS